MKNSDRHYLAFWREHEQGYRPRDVQVKDIRLTLIEKVFNPEPHITHSTSLVLDHIPEVVGKSVMDLGSGTGILALFCALKGARFVLATDIQNEALENTGINIQKHQMDNIIALRKSYLFRKVPERFDAILANLPIIPYKSQLNVYEELLSELPKHLSIGGKILITQASFGKPLELQKCIEKYNYQYEKVSTKRLDVSWYLFIVTI